MQHMESRSPIVAIGAIVLKDDRILLIRRGNPPNQGLWSVPGGKVKLGEKLQDAVRREIREECSIDCIPLDLYEVVERIYHTPDGEISYHYVIVDFLALWAGGEPIARDDALDVGWYGLEDLNGIQTTEGLSEVIHKLLLRYKSHLKAIY